MPPQNDIIHVCLLLSEPHRLLKRFLKAEYEPPEYMNPGYDADIKKKEMPEPAVEASKGAAPAKQGGVDGGPQFEETSGGVKDIVFARDMSIFDDKSNLVSMRALIQHENLLDLKELIKEQQEQQAQQQDKLNKKANTKKQ